MSHAEPDASRGYPAGKPPVLTDFMLLDGERRPLWSSDDLRDLLRHQLNAPIRFDLAESDARAAQRIEQLASGVTPPIRTFGELLGHPAPPADLLVAVKDFAKRKGMDPDTLLAAGALQAAVLRQHHRRRAPARAHQQAQSRPDPDRRRLASGAALGRGPSRAARASMARRNRIVASLTHSGSSNGDAYPEFGPARGQVLSS